MSDILNSKTVVPVLILGNNREHVHDAGSRAVEDFIRQHAGAKLLAIHTYTFSRDDIVPADEHAYLGIVFTPQAAQAVQP